MVKKVDHDTLDFAHGQWSKLPILTIWPRQFWNFSYGHGQKWPILTIWPRQFWNFGHGHGQKFLTIWPWHPDVGQMVKKSWSSYPPPPPPPQSLWRYESKHKLIWEWSINPPLISRYHAKRQAQFCCAAYNYRKYAYQVCALLSNHWLTIASLSLAHATHCIH